LLIIVQKQLKRCADFMALDVMKRHSRRTQLMLTQTAGARKRQNLKIHSLSKNRKPLIPQATSTQPQSREARSHLAVEEMDEAVAQTSAHQD
jgi:hypothetical protein